jgi:hypothetical protein
MKNKLTIAILSLIVLLFNFACKKILDAKSISNFEVITNSSNYNLGDSIQFIIPNEADVIQFYSGNVGFKYANKDRNFAIGTNILKFQTLVNSNKLNLKDDTIYLKICTDLKSYDSTGVANANWQDLTGLAKWPTVNSTTGNSTTSPYTYSGAIDISRFNNFDSVFIAFQVIGKQKASTNQRRWSIQGFTLSNILSDSTYTPLFFPSYNSAANKATDTLPNFSYVGWCQINVKNNPYPNFLVGATNYNAWNLGEYGVSATNAPIVLNNNRPCNANGITIATNYPITFDPGGTVKNNPDNEDWAITSPINLKTVRHDFPTVTIKNSAGTVGRGVRVVNNGGVYAKYSLLIDSTFKSGNTYDMVFVAQNLNVDQKNEQVKHISIKIN